ncbi:MAG: hypothetical protein LW845_16615 [Flammeovirgaceae bacterium]|nr:hypothetical protein [Flammeovirgaceae bacterium]
MSDNIGYTPGSGATVAADNIGGALHQRVKISVGSDGVAADASEGNPLPVTAVAELMEAIEALRFAVASLTKTIGFALPNALGQPIFEARQATAANLQMTATQAGTWNIGTVTALTNQAQIGGFAVNDVLPSFLAMGASNIRRNITVT